MVSLNTGSVLGVDVGFSSIRASSAACILSWSADTISWSIRRFRAVEPERTATFVALAAGHNIAVAAFDGPLAPSLALIGEYRLAEKMLTRRLGRRIGKPGQSNSPVGMRLNEAANTLADIVVDHCTLADADHPRPIHEKAIVEAFPTAFMGVMIDDPAQLSVQRNDRTDRYFIHLANTGALATLVSAILPRRRRLLDFASVTDHDERAALVCALAALCVYQSDYIAVGDHQGSIVLPPQRFWQPRAWLEFQQNAEELGRGSVEIVGSAPS